VSSEVPDKAFARSWPAPTEIAELLEALRAVPARDETTRLFHMLGSYPPRLRLAVNLKNFLGETALREIRDVLADGLRPEERQALSDVQKAGIARHLLEVAHGLLNVHERWIVKRALAKPMHKAWEHDRRHYRSGGKLLDEILGQDGDN